MSSAFFSARMARVLVLAVPCLPVLLSGCDQDEPYPANLKYSLRSDPIVIKSPSAEPWEPTPPGQLDKNIAAFPAQGGETVDPHTLSGQDRQQLEEALNAVFGTPANPTINVKDKDAASLVGKLRLDEETLKDGSRVYRRHCMHCHGVTGDGRGPTGRWVSPHPRDYRQGVFKFISTGDTARKPRRADLLRTLERGIEGTSMPSFSLLQEHEKEKLVSYVAHLSIRGEVERKVMEPILRKLGQEFGDTIRENVEGWTGNVLQGWADSDGKTLTPEKYPYGDDEDARLASVGRGFALFTDTKGDASCIKCHIDFGRQVPFKYDQWGTLVRPANLTAGVYRGGRRPIDLYWRIRGGIDGSNMPKAQLSAEGGGRSDPYWDLVNFVRALPYPHMLPPDVREKVYGPSAPQAVRKE